MKLIGIRCSNSDFAYTILSGEFSHPIINEKKIIKLPRTFTLSKKLKWFYLEIDRLIKEHEIKYVGIKGAEPLVKRSNSLDERIKYEGICFLVAELNSAQIINKRVNKTIAKSLVGKGQARLLNGIDLSPYCDKGNLQNKIKDAFFTAWSLMK